MKNSGEESRPLVKREAGPNPSKRGVQTEAEAEVEAQTEAEAGAASGAEAHKICPQNRH